MEKGWWLDPESQVKVPVLKAALESKKDFCDTAKNFPCSGLPGVSENFLLGPKYELCMLYLMVTFSL